MRRGARARADAFRSWIDCPGVRRSPSLLLRVGILLLAQREPDRRTGQIERIAQAVDQVTTVVVGYGVRAAGEQYEAWRPALRLGNVVQPDTPAGYRRRRMGGCDLGQPAVERAGGDALVPERMHVDDGLHESIESLPGQPRHCDDRHAPDLRQPAVGFLAQLV